MSWDGTKRRKTDNMDNFTPSGAFEGYVYAKLESMNKRLDDLPCGETFNRLNKCENDIANIKGRATVIGTVAGFISAFLTRYFFGK